MINLCLVGTGVIATEHMKALRVLGGVKARWVVSRREEAAEEFGRKWAFDHCGTNLDQALADSEIDLVLVTSPSEHHAEQATRSLRAGKQVIVEIPVALNLADAEAIAELAAGLKRRLLICHTARSHSGIREVRRRVQAEEFHVSHVAGVFAIPRRHNQSRGGLRSWIDNLLWHHGCHQVDTVMWVLGVDDVLDVRAITGRRHPQFGMAMDCSIQFHTEAEQLVTFALTYDAGALLWELRFFGQEDVLTFRNGTSFNEENREVAPPCSVYDTVSQDRQMLRALHDGKPCDYDVESVLPAMRVLQRAQASCEVLEKG